MTILVNHRACFEESLDDHPEDWDLRLAYADFLDDIGDTWGAVTQRYMATLKRAPDSQQDHIVFWSWPSLRHVDGLEQGVFGLLGTLHDNPGLSICDYPNRVSAESALCQALRLYSAAMDTWGLGPTSGTAPAEIKVCRCNQKAIGFTVVSASDDYSSKSFGRPYHIQSWCKECGWGELDDTTVLKWAQTPDPQSKTWEFLDTIRRTK